MFYVIVQLLPKENQLASPSSSLSLVMPLLKTSPEQPGLSNLCRFPPPLRSARLQNPRRRSSAACSGAASGRRTKETQRRQPRLKDTSRSRDVSLAWSGACVCAFTTECLKEKEPVRTANSLAAISNICVIIYDKY